MDQQCRLTTFLYEWLWQWMMMISNNLKWHQSCRYFIQPRSALSFLPNKESPQPQKWINDTREGVQMQFGESRKRSKFSNTCVLTCFPHPFWASFVPKMFGKCCTVFDKKYYETQRAQIQREMYFWFRIKGYCLQTKLNLREESEEHRNSLTLNFIFSSPNLENNTFQSLCPETGKQWANLEMTASN